MSQFRSEKMKLLQVFMARDAAHDTLRELGEIGALQFKDLNHDKSSFNRPHVFEVRKCDDMLRIMRFLKEVIETEKLPLTKHGNTIQGPPSSLEDWHERLQDIEKEVKILAASARDLQGQETELEEHRCVLREAAKWLRQQNRSFTVPAANGNSSSTEMKSLTTHDSLENGEISQKGKGMLGYVAGCIPTANIKDFNRTLFRKTRGNMLLLHQELENLSNPKKHRVTEPSEPKSVFIVFFSGDRSKTEIDKIANGYGAKKYGLPDSRPQQDEALTQIEERLKDLNMVIDRTAEFRRAKLEQVESWLEAWTVQALREKAIYHTLNKFNVDSSQQCYIAEAWCPEDDYDEVLQAIQRGNRSAAVPAVVNLLRPRDSPPTYFRSSRVAAGTQAIIDAYGIADYQEFNPAVFSVVTFPFLFGVMFGDIGHGLMMTLAAALLVIYEKQLAALANDEMMGTVYKGRYNLLLMGAFATYAGFIYNEIFSVPLELFGSSVWCSPETLESPGCDIPGINPEHAPQKWLRTNLDKAFKNGRSTEAEVVWNVYPLGTDPGFAHTANKLNSVNSFKMKFAIIAGVVQMVAGICCKLMNNIHFKDWITFRYVFIPEMIFINCIFGYLCILIMVKWTTNWDATFILNNEHVVSIPQIYCNAELSNVPCWTQPFYEDRDTVPDYGSSHLAGLPEHQWCMRADAPTAGCAVFRLPGGGLVVESDVFGSKELIDPLQYNNTLCAADPSYCVLWKQVPPSLLDTLIKMFMNIGTVPTAEQLVPGQGSLQKYLILLAVLSVPVLLLMKPYQLKWQHQRREAAKAGRRPGAHGQELHDEDEDEALGGHGSHGDHGFDFGDEMVHQMIHTIEYVLGCISNTASYLRLWALSLAHAQLSEVFWEKTVVDIGLGGEPVSPIMIFVTVTAWAVFTVGVLMGMESLSAFLHALRLHWVEYMNKFFSGTGVKFVPFAFRDLSASSLPDLD